MPYQAYSFPIKIVTASAFTARMGRAHSDLTRSARSTTRRIRSVISAHAGEAVSRPCQMLLPLPPHSLKGRPE